MLRRLRKRLLLQQMKEKLNFINVNLGEKIKICHPPLFAKSLHLRLLFFGVFWHCPPNPLPFGLFPKYRIFLYLEYFPSSERGYPKYCSLHHNHNPPQFLHFPPHLLHSPPPLLRLMNPRLLHYNHRPHNPTHLCHFPLHLHFPLL